MYFKIAEIDIPHLKDILLDISPETIKNKQEVLSKVWRLFSYQRPSEPGDAFHAAMTLLSWKKNPRRVAGPAAWT